ncbi:Hypothetical predicted protein [Lecanosticta acicola]|uniref:RNase MRP protein 1 RNA binding domain-containing protein n=1 Tax=Lecanosticta acicola TaxID=111012 RepID=A0AAI8YW36_9PEZI|nr:Hypothetical predicted protein [Lecanosticta acicola]
MATAQDLLNITAEDQSQLLHLADLLHLFHHRNKNQHRRSVWYRQFSLFRRQLNNLTHGITLLNTVPATNVARARKKAQDAKTVQLYQDRISFWRDVMVAKWQHSFSQVIADGRFSVLGLALLAILAEVCKIVGILVELEELGQGEVEKVLEEFGREEWDGADKQNVDVEGKEDLGEVVRRYEQSSIMTVDSQSPPIKSMGTKKRPMDPSSNPVKKKKRRKVAGDAIDDIFG